MADELAGQAIAVLYQGQQVGTAGLMAELRDGTHAVAGVRINAEALAALVPSDPVVSGLPFTFVVYHEGREIERFADLVYESGDVSMDGETISLRSASFRAAEAAPAEEAGVVWHSLAEAADIPDGGAVLLKAEGEWSGAEGFLHPSGTWIVTSLPRWINTARPAETPLSEPTHWRQRPEDWKAQRIAYYHGEGVMEAARAAAREAQETMNDPVPVDLPALDDPRDAAQRAQLEPLIEQQIAAVGERHVRYVLEGMILEDPPMLPPPTVDESVRITITEGLEFSLAGITPYGMALVDRYRELAIAQGGGEMPDGAVALLSGQPEAQPQHF